MSGISIFCKSYRDDLERAVALVASVKKYNREALSFYISVPQNDLELFQNRLGTEGVKLLTDEAIIAANPAISLASYKSLPGHISQQIVKSEFWRINPVENYLCVDSDSRFIRDFFISDFLATEDQPYTILHEGKAFLEFCMASGLKETKLNFESTAQMMRDRFGRQGPSYNFGPFPVIWNRKVWHALSVELEEQRSNILEAIVAFPHEASWYGETLLKHRSIPLLPKEPIFKAFLYLEEYEAARRAGLDEKALSALYLGVVYQSNWYPKRLNPLRRIAYKIKRQIKRANIL